MREILPAAVRSAESDGSTAGLLPAEAAALGPVAEIRYRDFSAGRACGRRALGELGVPIVAILPGLDRAPQWPAGLVGSLTHCAGYAAAAVARTEDIRSVGIDAEPNRSLPDGVLAMVTGAGERRRLEGLPDIGTAWDCVLFSAKESIYKAWYPMTKSWLGFEDVDLSIDPDSGSFSAVLQVPGPRLGADRLTSFVGLFTVRDGFIRTAVTIAAAPSQSDEVVVEPELMAQH